MAALKLGYRQRPRSMSPVRITTQQDFSDAPIRLRLEQTESARGMVMVRSEAFVLDARDALRLVVALAPLAGAVLKEIPQTAAEKSLARAGR